VADLEDFQKRLGYSFKDPGLLRLSLTHPSVAHECGTNIAHNQRLEFLGDAVLQLILTRELYDRFPGVGEGPLTKARAQLVNRRSLALQGRRVGLGQYLILGRGEDLNGGRERPSALADAFEAIVGALFLDGGFEAAQRFVLEEFKDLFGEVEVLPNLDNPKGELQEFLQAQSAFAPNYRLESVTGPDHDRMFECAVYHNGMELGRGTGKSKKAAESQAAVEALKGLRRKRNHREAEN
jgi:ribonuclease-3